MVGIYRPELPVILRYPAIALFALAMLVDSLFRLAAVTVRLAVKGITVILLLLFSFLRSIFYWLRHRFHMARLALKGLYLRSGSYMFRRYLTYSGFRHRLGRLSTAISIRLGIRRTLVKKALFVMVYGIPAVTILSVIIGGESSKGNIIVEAVVAATRPAHKSTTTTSTTAATKTPARPLHKDGRANWLNSFVDKNHLPSDVLWHAVQLQAVFDAEMHNATPRFPDASHPVDDVPSLSAVKKKLLSSPKFVEIHAPGLAAIEKVEEYERARVLNDYGEPYEEGVKGKSRTEIKKMKAEEEGSAEKTTIKREEAKIVARHKTGTKPLPPMKNRVIRLPVSGRGFKRKDNPGAAVDASGIMFGVSTTYSRLLNNDFATIDDWARWLTDGHGNSNGAFLFLALHRPRNDETEIIEGRLRDSGISFHVLEDWGDMREGVGGGPNDVNPLPVVPDPAAVRYSNMLNWMKDYDFLNFGGGRSAEMHADGSYWIHNAARKTIYALIDDDVFFPNMGRLLAKLREHRGISDSVDLASENWSLEDDSKFNMNLWLGFPSDPWSDWTFHNGTTLADQFVWEEDRFGHATSTEELKPKFRQRDGAAVLPTAYGGGAVFLAADLAHRIVDLPCSRRTTDDGITNTIFKANRAAFFKGEHPEADWDEQLHRCVHQYIPEAQLRIIPSFYGPSDVALYGSDWESAELSPNTFGRMIARMGQYAGGQVPMAMHNSRTWHKYDVGAAHQVTKVCGDDCFLQRFLFPDNWVLTNGHSLVHYDDLTTYPLERQSGFDDGFLVDNGKPLKMASPLMMERFRAYQDQREYYKGLNIEMEHVTRPRNMEAVVWKGERKTYKLEETSVAEDGSVIQAYVRRRTGPLRDLTAIGGREHFSHVLDRMAVPDVAKGGLEGDEIDQATEAPPPEKDEIILVVWKPPKDGAKHGESPELKRNVPYEPTIPYGSLWAPCIRGFMFFTSFVVAVSAWIMGGFRLEIFC